MANVLAVADAKAILDNIAKQIDIIRTAYGDDVTAATAAYGAGLNRSRIVALADPADWEIEADLLVPLVATLTAYESATEQQNKHTQFMSALAAHVDPTTKDLNGWLGSNDIRVHPYVRNVWPSLHQDHTFYPDILDLATFAITGAITGTFADVGSISRSLYASAQLEVRTTTAITNEMTVTVTGQNDAGATVALPATTIPALTGNNTSIEIGTIADRLYNVSAIAITGGTNAESFKIRTKVERAIALA